MPVPACFHLADDVFPRVRAEAGRRLVRSGWSQSRAANALGVSQAMVSKYQHGAVEGDAAVLRLVDELLADLDDPRPRAGPSPWCTTLSVDHDRGGGALDDLLEAERILLAGDLLPVMPQVGLNLARALPDAETARDVLAYPARIVRAGNRILRPAPPVLGGSGHLAACLLALRARDERLHALANIRGGPTAQAAGAVLELQGDGDRTDLFCRAVGEAPEAPRLVHDPGAVGIESCLYVAGETAVDVARTILRIAQEIP